ncbi:MAG TPA: hypothetical protein VML00_12890, partial [Bacteroidota bacterium]|nr:hypothetical protein [Bacteroidota bacterium]
LGCYNTTADIDALAEMLERVARGEYRGTYVQNPASGAFHAKGYEVDFARYCSLAAPPVAGRVHSEAS